MNELEIYLENIKEKNPILYIHNIINIYKENPNIKIINDILNILKSKDINIDIIEPKFIEKNIGNSGYTKQSHEYFSFVKKDFFELLKNFISDNYVEDYHDIIFPVFPMYLFINSSIHNFSFLEMTEKINNEKVIQDVSDFLLSSIKNIDKYTNDYDEEQFKQNSKKILDFLMVLDKTNNDKFFHHLYNNIIADENIKIKFYNVIYEKIISESLGLPYLFYTKDLLSYIFIDKSENNGLMSKYRKSISISNIHNSIKENNKDIFDYLTINEVVEYYHKNDLFDDKLIMNLKKENVQSYFDIIDLLKKDIKENIYYLMLIFHYNSLNDNQKNIINKKCYNIDIIKKYIDEYISSMYLENIVDNVQNNINSFMNNTQHIDKIIESNKKSNNENNFIDIIIEKIILTKECKSNNKNNKKNKI